MTYKDLLDTLRRLLDHVEALDAVADAARALRADATPVGIHWIQVYSHDSIRGLFAALDVLDGEED